MMNAAKPLRWMLVLGMGIAAATAAAQTPPPGPGNAQAEAGDPRAETSAPPAPAVGPARAAPQPVAKVRPPTAPSGTSAGTKKPVAGTDRVDLTTATVTGDREQPKVMYIVPWKRADIGDLSGKPMNSLLDEVLAPVDRDEFKREVVYYQAVNADASQNDASVQPAKQGEK